MPIMTDETRDYTAKLSKTAKSAVDEFAASDSKRDFARLVYARVMLQNAYDPDTGWTATGEPYDRAYPYDVLDRAADATFAALMVDGFTDAESAHGWTADAILWHQMTANNADEDTALMVAEHYLKKVKEIEAFAAPETTAGA